MLPQPKVMVRWIDGRGVVVGSVSQGVQRDMAGRLGAVYIAAVVGLPPDPCPRFACACNKVEDALRRMRITARRQM